MSDFRDLTAKERKNRIIGLLVVIITLLGLAGVIYAISAPDNYDIRKLAGGPSTVTKWHPAEFSFNAGVSLNEAGQSPDNPFLDYRLTTTFTSPSGSTFVVPGFFDGNGQGSGGGNVWKVRFSPNEVGSWSYSANLKKGSNIAINPAQSGSDVSLSDASGSFNVTARNPNAPGFLKWGALEYVGKHYLKFADGNYWVKSGTDSPENFLGYSGFDNTQSHGGHNPNFLHDYSEHVGDWRSGDPDWGGGKGKGIIGALNYLNSIGINSIYFLPMNLNGDGQDTYPYIGHSNDVNTKTHFDVSKLDQWNTVFEHAIARGINLNFQLGEIENWNFLDNGNLGVERKVFYREMVARFGHNLAIKWILSEESPFSAQKHKDFASYIASLDPYDHPISVHTPNNNVEMYDPLYGNPNFSASSLQFGPDNTDNYSERIWSSSEQAGRSWVVDLDEQTELVDTDKPDVALALRKRVIYDAYLSGANLELYLGYYFNAPPPGGDINLEDFRTRTTVFKYLVDARKFINLLPFWEMHPNDGLTNAANTSTGSPQTLFKHGSVYAVYFPSANANGSSNGTINMAGANSALPLRWYNPRTGILSDPVGSIGPGSSVSIPSAPSDHNEDWAMVIGNISGTPPSPPPNPSPSPSSNPSPSPSSNPSPSPSPPPVDSPLSFSIRFQGVIVERPHQTVSVSLTPTQGDGPTVIFDALVVSGANGTYSGGIDSEENIAAQVYDISIKGPLHLSKTFKNVQIEDDNNYFDWSDTLLLAGDINQTGESNNFVNALDIGKVVEDYFPDSPANSPADINFDGTVNALDIGMVIENYFLRGD